MLWIFIAREKYLGAFGIKIIKLKNEEILKNLEFSPSFLKRGIKGEL
jgi:very-short-patch-repair endonuclease